MKKYFLTFMSFLLIVLVCLIGNSYTFAALKDSEILAILIVASENEILAANEALKNTNSPTIKHYANTLKDQLIINLEEILAVKSSTGIKPEGSNKVIRLQRAGKNLIEELSQLTDKQFDVAYINAMAHNHIQLARMIDVQLLASAKNSSVKNLLLATRPHVKDYLKQTEAIQNSLK